MLLCYICLLLAGCVYLFQILLVFVKKLGVIDEYLGYVNPNYRTLFEGLNKRHGQQSALYQLGILMRKLIFAIVVVALSDVTYP